MIAVTGSAGFIGSVVASALNKTGREDLILVDDFSFAKKNFNINNIEYEELIHRNDFVHYLNENPSKFDFIIHLGARTDTTETDIELFNRLNLNYTKAIWTACAKFKIPLIYASSAATYGLGEFGYKDEHDLCEKLQPLNAYGDSKNDFDIWALKQKKTPPFWAGLKFFNVYGPNEFHKTRMASVIFHTFKQVKKTGEMNLFRSHNTNFKDGKQLRDFIYVKDIVSVILFLKKQGNKNNSGIYNLGTGKARSFYDLAKNTFIAMGKDVKINFIDIPEDIRENYQYFTEANMQKLKNIGYTKEFTSLEDGVKDYVENYLLETKYF